MQQSDGEPYHVTLEIENKQCKGLRMLRTYGIQRYALSDIRGVPGGLTRHLAKMPTEEVTKIPLDPSIKIHGGGKSKKGASAWFDSDGCEVCKTILSNSSFLVSGRHIEDYTIVYSFVVPSFDAFKRIMSTLEAGGLKPKILEMGRFKPQGKILTEKQERALWLALKMGFFEYPRKLTLLELSRRVGVGLSTLSEITRRGIRRLLEDHFKT